MAMFNSEENAQKFYDKLDELFKGLKKIGNSIKKDKSKIEESLDNVMKKLNELNGSNIAVKYQLRTKILEGMQSDQVKLNKDNLSKGINETLASISLLKKIMAPAKPSIFARFRKSKSIDNSEGTLVITNKNNKGCELYKDLPIDDVMKDLYDSIRDNDVECVRDILKQRREDIAEDSTQVSLLSTEALEHDKRGYILQLLINADLFNVGGFEDKLNEAKVKAQSEPNAFRLKRLLAKISINEEKKEPKERKYRQQLYSIVPVIMSYNELNSKENIQQLTDHINNNKYSEIEKMLVNGKVDLQDLADEQLFDILNSTASKIELNTMKLLLDYGFDISSARSDDEKNIFAIIDKFSSSILNFLKDRADIKALANKSHYIYGPPLQFHLSKDNPNLKTIKILFEKFGADYSLNQSPEIILEQAISSNNSAIVEYLLKQMKVLFKPFYLDSLILQVQHNIHKVADDKKAQKAAKKIAELFEKKFKYHIDSSVKDSTDFKYREPENLQTDLQQSIKTGNLKEARSILDGCDIENNNFNRRALTRLAMDRMESSPNAIEIIQLLANKGLFDQNDISIDEYFNSERIINAIEQIEAGDHPDIGRKHAKLIRLLTKFKMEYYEDEYVRLPVISKDDSVVTNSEEHIKDFQKWVGRNDCKAIASMINSGKIYLPDLSGNQCGELLEKCARKIKPEAMTLLLDNGFYTRAKQQNVNVFLRYIDQFSKDVLKFLENNKITQRLIDEDLKSGNKSLSFHIENNNLKAVEYLLATTHSMYDRFDIILKMTTGAELTTKINKMKEHFAKDKKSMKIVTNIEQKMISLHLIS